MNPIAHEVAKGIPFPDFVWREAMAYVDGLEREKVQAQERLKKAQEKLKGLQAASDETVKTLATEAQNRLKADCDATLALANVLRERVNQLSAALEGFKPASPEHEGLKRKLAETLRTLREGADKAADYPSRLPLQRRPAAWKDDEVARTEYEIRYYTEKLASPTHSEVFRDWFLSLLQGVVPVPKKKEDD